MKCLSVSQPFADLIVTGQKKIDLRGWNTKHRGDILIHAPIKIMKNQCKRFGIKSPVTGAIVGRACITDVKLYNDTHEIREDFRLHLAQENLERKRYGFVLSNPYKFASPIPKKGQLGLFEVPAPSITSDAIISDIMDENHRYRFVGHH